MHFDYSSETGFDLVVGAGGTWSRVRSIFVKSVASKCCSSVKENFEMVIHHQESFSTTE